MAETTLLSFKATASSTPSFSFEVTRRSPELIAPAEPTPREYKLLSDIDDQEGLRLFLPFIHFYRKDSSLGSAKDPVEVIREAIAKTLVFYYPLAGRLREGPGRKLGVDCTGEGVMFIEADADVRIEEFGDNIQPPFPCLGELLYDAPGSEGILNCPLMLIQVTRMQCGGFIFAIRSNHTMTDAIGVAQFVHAVAEIARGESSPSVKPAWQRELLSARDPPQVTRTHREYDEVHHSSTTIGTNNIVLEEKVRRSFFFGPTEIAALRSSIPPHPFPRPSTFDILTACIWRCHTLALQLNPEEEVRILFAVNARGKIQSLPFPTGYYGNVVACPVAISAAGNLCKNPLQYALELVMKAKGEVTEEYMRSLADFMVIKGRPLFYLVRTFVLSSLVRVGFAEVDFGWGKPVYGGPTVGGSDVSFYVDFTNAKGERGILVPICLPGPAMKSFQVELETLLKSGQL